jgi:uncharacterized protein (UPF0261 family)
MAGQEDDLRIVLIGTLDTKLEELLYLRERILSRSPERTSVILLDVGRTPSTHPDIIISQADLLAALPPEDQPLDLFTAPRGEVIAHLASAATSYLAKHFRAASESTGTDRLSIHGIVSAGGSGNTSLASSVMRNANLPVGLPKLIVSTIASGDTSHIVSETDVVLMPSVVDVAGLNSLLRSVLDNAAASMAGMATAYAQRCEDERSTEEKSDEKRLRVGITMYVRVPIVPHVSISGHPVLVQ